MDTMHISSIPSKTAHFLWIMAQSRLLKDHCGVTFGSDFINHSVWVPESNLVPRIRIFCCIVQLFSLQEKEVIMSTQVLAALNTVSFQFFSFWGSNVNLWSSFRQRFHNSGSLRFRKPILQPSNAKWSLRCVVVLSVQINEAVNCSGELIFTVDTAWSCHQSWETGFSSSSVHDFIPLSVLSISSMKRHVVQYILPARVWLG